VIAKQYGKSLIFREAKNQYDVPGFPKRLNEQVKRNRDRFPEDFMFQLTKEESEVWGSLRSQFATLKRGQHSKYLPYAFTEHGAIIAAT
jgi:hypothetical protein